MMKPLLKQLAILWCAMLVLCPHTLQAQGTLQLYVDNVEVTEANASNVLAGLGAGKDGCVSYDFATHTLTLKNAKLTHRITVTAERPDQLITMRLEGKNEIYSPSRAIWVMSPLQVEGPGELYINTTQAGDEGTGFMLAGNHPHLHLKIKGTKVRIESAAQGRAIFSPVMREGFVVLDKADLECNGLIAGMKEIYLHGCRIVNDQEIEIATETRPNGYSCAVVIKKGTDQHNYGKATFAPDNSYPIQVSSTVVTEENAADILAASGKKGVARYDQASNTLFLSGLNLKESDENGIFTRFSPIDKPLTISLEGENKIESPYSGMLLFGNTVITGGGTIELVATNHQKAYGGILIADEDKLTIEECTLKASGTFGISGIRRNSKLLIRNATVDIRCMNKTHGSCIEGFGAINLEEAIYYAPEGAHFNKDLYGITVDDKELWTGDLLIIPNKGSASDQLQALDPPTITVAHEQLTIALNGQKPQLAKLYTLDGELVRNQLVEGSAQWHLAAGCYILVIGDSVNKVLVP